MLKRGSNHPHSQSRKVALPISASSAELYPSSSKLTSGYALIAILSQRHPLAARLTQRDEILSKKPNTQQAIFGSHRNPFTLNKRFLS